MTTNNITPAQLIKYLDITPSDWAAISENKRAYRAAESIATNVIRLEQSLEAIKATFQLLDDTRLDSLFSQHKSNVTQAGSLLVAQIKQQRTSYGTVLSALEQKGSRFEDLTKQLVAVNTRVADTLKRALEDYKPAGFPRPVLRAKVQTKNMDNGWDRLKSSASLEAASIFKRRERKDGVLSAVRELMAKAKDLTRGAWDTVKDEVVGSYRSLLLEQNRSLELLVKDMARLLRQGSVLREVLLPDKELTIPISLASGFTHSGVSLTQLVVRQDGMVTVDTTAGATVMAASSLPRRLYRLIKPSLETLGVAIDTATPSSTPEHLDEDLVRRERTKGFNPKIDEIVRLMFERYIPEELQRDRFQGESDIPTTPEELYPILT